MLLAVDTGNTQTHIGVFRKETLVAQWRTSTEPGRTADELALIFQQFLALVDLSFSREVTGVVIGSVVPTQTTALREMVARYFHFEPVVVEAGIRTGLPVKTDHPREVGADRIVNAVAAIELVGPPAIVIDFGTATTFDAIGERGDFLGGGIAPGRGGGLEARSARPAEEVAPLADGVERRGGAEVDHDGRRPDESDGGDGVDDPVGADLPGVVGLHGQARADAGLDDDGFEVEVAGHHLSQGGGLRRDDAADHHTGDLPRERQADQGQELLEDQAKLIRRAAGLRRGPPLRDQALPAEDADVRLGVPGVDGEQHSLFAPLLLSCADLLSCPDPNRTPRCAAPGCGEAW